jgi:hypothetical protein
MSETSEIAEMYKEHKEERRHKKVMNMEYSTELLKTVGIPFEAKNNGIHLIVEGIDCKIDYWPSTGKFIARNGNEGRGIKNLLRLCQQ